MQDDDLGAAIGSPRRDESTAAEAAGVSTEGIERLERMDGTIGGVPVDMIGARRRTSDSHVVDFHPREPRRNWGAAADRKAREPQAMKFLFSMAALCAALAGSPSARAEPNCMARALADVPAMEAPEQVRSKSNGAFGPIAQVKVDKKTGRMFYCGNKSYCYDSNAFELITPCRIKVDKDYNMGEYFVYFTR